MTKQKVWGGCSEKQRLVLMENEVDVLLTGGSAGSGKSYLSLLKAAGLVQDPSAKIMVLRLSYPMLKDLISTSKLIYPHFGGVYKTQARMWVFPNGAEIDFKAMPKDLYEVQGWERTTYIIDESAEFQLEDILALMGRLRSATYKGKMSLLLTCNPSKTSFLLPFVEPFLDDEGIPKAGTENIIRYFVVQNNRVKWGTSEQDCYEKHGMGMTLGKDFMPLKFKFIPMHCTDNTVLMKADPAYTSRLLSAPRVNVLRLYHGSWYAAVEGSSMVQEDQFEIVDFPPTEVVGKYRGWDLASSIPHEGNNFKCDWTVGTLMSKDSLGNFYIEDVVRFQKQIDGVLQGIRETAWKDGLDVVQILPVDPGQAGKVAAKFYTTELATHGVTTKLEIGNGHSSKTTRFGPFASVAATGGIKVVRGLWNREWFDEVCFFNGDRKNTDDQADSTSTTFNHLCKTQSMPIFSITPITQSSPVPSVP